MNNDDPKPGVVIDVEAEPDGEPDPQAAVEPDNEQRQHTKEEATGSRSGVVPLALALLALLAVGAAAFFGYPYWVQLNDDIATLQSRISETAQQQQGLQGRLNEATEALQSQQEALGKQEDILAQQTQAVDAARNAFEQQEKILADENLRMQEREAELRSAVADVHRRVGRSGTQWIVAETEYLMRIANHRLILARDTEAAAVALQLADQRLRDTRDPGWAGVRSQLARDIAKLTSFEDPDLAGISARLAAMIEQVPQLDVSRATIGPERTLPEREPSAAAPSERNWDTLMDDLLSGFKNSVRIRERGKPVQAMLAPEHEYFLYENLKLQLESARLGAARKDQALFQQNLKTARDWLTRYFDPSDGTAAAIDKTLAELMDQEIHPELPDISQSLRALQARKKLMESIAGGSSTTALPEGGAESQ